MVRHDPMSGKRFRELLAVTALLAALVFTGLAIWRHWLNSELRDAAAHHDTPGVKRFLSWGASPNAADQRGETALMLAARALDRDSVQVLLAAGAQANAVNMDGKGTLAMAEEGAAEVKAEYLRGPEKWQGPVFSPSARGLFEIVQQSAQDSRREQLRRYPEMTPLLRRHGARR